MPASIVHWNSGRRSWVANAPIGRRLYICLRTIVLAAIGLQKCVVSVMAIPRNYGIIDCYESDQPNHGCGIFRIS